MYRYYESALKSRKIPCTLCNFLERNSFRKPSIAYSSETGPAASTSSSLHNPRRRIQSRSNSLPNKTKGGKAAVLLDDRKSQELTIEQLRVFERALNAGVRALVPGWRGFVHKPVERIQNGVAVPYTEPGTEKLHADSLQRKADGQWNVPNRKDGSSSSGLTRPGRAERLNPTVSPSVKSTRKSYKNGPRDTVRTMATSVSRRASSHTDIQALVSPDDFTSEEDLFANQSFDPDADSDTFSGSLISDSVGTSTQDQRGRKAELQCGDIVTFSVASTETRELGVFLRNDSILTLTRGRRALLHSRGNLFVSCRYEDLLYRIPSAVHPKLASAATRILQLSPAQYEDNLAELDREGISPQVHARPDLPDFDAQQLQWDSYGIDYEQEGWHEAWDAKLAVARLLNAAALTLEDMTKEVIQLGIGTVHTRWASLASDTAPVYVVTEDVYNVLYGPEEAEARRTGRAFELSEQQRQYRMAAIGDYLLSNAHLYVADQVEFLTVGRFRVRPLDETACLQEVRTWTRANSPQMESFLISARAALQQSDISPSQSPAWSKSDLRIIQFLKLILETRRVKSGNPFVAAAASILNQIEDSASTQVKLLASAGEVPASFTLRARLINLLKGIGVFKKWENLVLRHRELGLQRWSNELALASKQYSRSSTEQITTVDGLDTIRHDFGQLPVYVIDDPSATELDDGISISPANVPDSTGRPTYWLHMHIADPTANLQPTDAVARLAAERVESAYFPEQVWPMIDLPTIQRHGWSLGSSVHSKHQQGQTALTFSARVDEDGILLEQKVEPSIIRNVKVTTYDAVAEVLQAGTTQNATPSVGLASIKWAPAGSTHQTISPNREVFTSMTARERLDLKLLERLSKALRRKRVARTLIGWNQRASEVTLGHSDNIIPTGAPAMSSRDAPHPSIQMNLSTGGISGINPAQNMVAQLMVLAGQIAARYLSSKRTPIAYRGQDAPIMPSQEDLALLMASRDPETGEVPYRMVVQTGAAFQAAYNSLHPVDHWPMGITAQEGGYVRATSPLRRYGDLLVHWQLKSTLLPASAQTVRPPFSSDDVARLVKQIERTGRYRKRTETRAKLFWKLYALSNKLEEVKLHPERDPAAANLLLGGLKGTIERIAIVTISLEYNVSVLLHDLGFMATAVVPINPAPDLALNQQVTVDVVGLVLDDYSKCFVKIRGI